MRVFPLVFSEPPNFKDNCGHLSILVCRLMNSWISMWRGHVYQKIYSMKNFYVLCWDKDGIWCGMVWQCWQRGWGWEVLKFTTFQSGIKRNKITFLKLRESRNKNIKRLFMLSSCFVPKLFIINHTIFSLLLT